MIQLKVEIGPKWSLGGFTNIKDAEDLLSTPGEQVTVVSKRLTTSQKDINVNRSIILTGKFRTTFILHGNINVDIVDAMLINAVPSQPSVFIATDFNGSISIADSVINYNGGKPVKSGIAINIADASIQFTKLAINNSRIAGIAAIVNKIELSNDVKINAIDTSENATSLLSAYYFDNQNASLELNSPLLLYSTSEYESGPNQTRFDRLIIKNGYADIKGSFDFEDIDVNLNWRSRRQLEIIKFSPINANNATIYLHNLNIISAPKNASIIYARSITLELNEGNLGNPSKPNMYSVSIENTIVKLNDVKDFMKWNLIEQNYLINNSEMTNSSLLNLAKIYPSKLMLTEEHQTMGQGYSNISAINEAKTDPPAGIETDAENENTDDKTDKESVDPEKELNDLIGLKTVKEKLNSYIANAKMNQIKKSRGIKVPTNLSRHLVFGGSPGTGKTTVAKLVAQILYDNGALPSSYLLEVTAKDLIGVYLGETQQKTHKVFLDVLEHKGGVLFIDEAYSLKEDSQFNKDAVSQLLTDSVDYRDKIIVILAGYTNEMRELFDTANAGLRSRFTNWVDFPDYTDRERIQIFDLMCKKQTMLFGKNQAAHDKYIRSKQFHWLMNYYNRDHSNGRSVANLVQELIMTRDTRLAKLPVEQLNNISNTDMITVTAKDIVTLYNENMKAYKQKD